MVIGLLNGLSRVIVRLRGLPVTEYPNYNRVKAMVDKVLEENSIAEPPIDPWEIAENNGIKVQRVTFGTHKEIAGFFDFEKNIIYVNSEESNNRQNFTVAHELGHHFLHRGLFEKDPKKYSVLLRAPMGAAVDPLEKEANAFAAHLLVPRKMLKKYASVAGIQDLARLFIVSPEVIRNRMSFEFSDRPF